MKKKTSIVTRIDSQVELRKAVEAIAIRPTRGKLTLLMRKSYNVLLQHAQEQDKDQLVYRIRLSDLVRNASWDSNDYEAMREHLRRMKETTVEWHSTSDAPEKRWGLSSLLAEVEILEDTGHLVVEYTFGPKIKKRLLDPDVYSRLNLQFQSKLRTNAGVALYEICSRFITNPGGLTNRAPWPWWHPVLTGNPDSDNELVEYKYFKRDTLKPAISEVNRLTDIAVELVEHKNGRKISEIQFRIARHRQTSLDLGSGPIIDTDLLARILKLGIAQSEAAKLYADHEEGKIRANLEMVEARIMRPGATPVHSPAALFRDSLKRDYAGARPALPVKPTAPSPSIADTKAIIRAKFQNHSYMEARKLFAEMLAPQQQEVVELFRQERIIGDALLTKAFDKGGLASKRVEVAFASWFATHTWGEPSEETLLSFAIEQGFFGGGLE